MKWTCPDGPRHGGSCSRNGVVGFRSKAPAGEAGTGELPPQEHARAAAWLPVLRLDAEGYLAGGEAGQALEEVLLGGAALGPIVLRGAWDACGMGSAWMGMLGLWGPAAS